MKTKFWISIGTFVGVLAGYLANWIFPLTNLGPDTWAIFSIVKTVKIDTWAALVGTLIGSAIVVFSAFMVLSKQENLRRHAAFLKRQSQQRAARAMLSMDLSKLCSYAEDCADLIKKSLASRVKLVSESSDLPELDSSVLDRLTRLVKLLDGDNVHKVVDLINCIQVQHARFESVISYDPSKTLNLDTSVISTVELRLRAESMFPFSRQESNHIPSPPFSREQVNTAFWQLNFSEVLPSTTKNSIYSSMEKLSPIGPSIKKMND